MKILRFLDSKNFSHLLSITASGLLIANLWFGLGKFQWQPTPDQNTIIQPTYFMKFNYEKAWKEVAELEQKGLPKSALEKVELILQTAREEGEDSQFIKALIYQGKYKSQLEEDGLVEAIFRMQKETEITEGALKSILQSMLAEMYAGYLSNNQWQFRNRTTTVEFKPQDVRTWTIQQLQDKSADLYWKSLINNELAQIDIADYEPILFTGKNDNQLRPTLYDFLAHRAIDHFMNEQSYLSQPAYQFYIDSPFAFDSAENFVKWKIETKDSSSQKLQVLLLLQEVISGQIEKDIEHNLALLDVDLKRLKFVHQNAVLGEKDELYLKALEKLQKRYDGHIGEAEIMAAIAGLYHQKGIGYQVVSLGEKDEQGERKWFLKKAHDLCNEVLKAYPNTVGATQCQGILSQILQPSLHLQVEEVNLPGEPFLGKIDYRNTPKVWLRIVRLDTERRGKLEEQQQKPEGNKQVSKYLNSLPPVRSWSLDLPDDGDFHQHAIEFKIDELPLGQYVIQVADNQQFDMEKGVTGYLFTHISKLGSWTRQGDGGSTSFVVFDRQNGQPLEGVEAEFFSRRYNSVFRRNELKKAGSTTSDKNGFIRTSLGDNDRSFSLLLRNGKDTLYTDQYFYDNRYNNQKRGYEQTNFFPRPGHLSSRANRVF